MAYQSKQIGSKSGRAQHIIQRACQQNEWGSGWGLGSGHSFCSVIIQRACQQNEWGSGWGLGSGHSFCSVGCDAAVRSTTALFSMPGFELCGCSCCLRGGAASWCLVCIGHGIYLELKNKSMTMCPAAAAQSRPFAKRQPGRRRCCFCSRQAMSLPHSKSQHKKWRLVCDVRTWDRKTVHRPRSAEACRARHLKSTTVHLNDFTIVCLDERITRMESSAWNAEIGIVFMQAIVNTWLYW